MGTQSSRGRLRHGCTPCAIAWCASQSVSADAFTLAHVPGGGRRFCLAFCLAAILRLQVHSLISSHLTLAVLSHIRLPHHTHLLAHSRSVRSRVREGDRERLTHTERDERDRCPPQIFPSPARPPPLLNLLTHKLVSLPPPQIRSTPPGKASNVPHCCLPCSQDCTPPSFQTRLRVRAYTTKGSPRTLSHPPLTPPHDSLPYKELPSSRDPETARP